MVRLILFAIVLVSFTASSTALMPPHVRKIEPVNGSILKDNTITIHGYSLKYIELKKDVKLVDVSTGKSVAFKHTVDCKSVGECGDNYKPGSCQLKCVMTVKIESSAKTTQVKLTILGMSATYTIRPAQPPKAPKAPKAPKK